MLGLAIIFGFLAWLILTLIAMWFCGRIAKNSGKSRRVGLFWGFMLVMGWHYLIWGIEYVRMYVIVAYQCQKSGIWVYVPPRSGKKCRKWILRPAMKCLIQSLILKTSSISSINISLNTQMQNHLNQLDLNTFWR